MSREFVDFERPIAELEARINELKHSTSHVGEHVNIAEEISRLEKKREKLVVSIFSNLDPGQVVKIARHPERPYFRDYVEHVFDDFDEMHGDRHFADGQALIGGLARIDGRPVMIIGQQKGREVEEKLKCNFGMPRPEDYRKAERLMRTAERFGLPVLTFIDTPGAYPGVDAERRNQSEAIANNLFVMARLKTPIVCTVIGEGGSGGALAIGVGDHVAMLEHSIYSVISPEGCASILWKSAERAKDAATAMGITSGILYEHGLIDSVISEPSGGAHSNFHQVASNIKAHLLTQLDQLTGLAHDALLGRRYQRLMMRTPLSEL